MDVSLSSVGLPALSTILSAGVLYYVKWTREDIRDAVRDLKAVKDTVSVNSGRITHLEQYTHEYHELTDGRLDRWSSRTSDIGAKLERMEATISVCPNCPQPGNQKGTKR